MKWTLLIIGVCFFVPYGNCKGLKEEFTWTRINYEWPTSQRSPENQKAYFGQKMNSGFFFPGETNGGMGISPSNNYIFENNIPMGANRWQNKLFVTVPRRRNGVPSTLNYIWLNSTERHNVPLIPYPDWETNQLPASGETGHLVSVYRTAVDACNRLWMVDTGRIETPGNNTQVQPPAIVIIDLLTNQIIRRYTLKDSDVRPESTLASIIVDLNPSSCGDAFAYIPDLSGFGLIVYSLRENDSWRITHNYFYVESLAGEFFIGGIHFQWNDGVFSLGLTDIQQDGFRTVYFHSMAGTHIYSVSTRILRNRQLSTRSYHENDFKVEIDRGEGAQTSASDLHKPSGILFLGLVNQNALGCWNTRKGARLENFDIIHKNDQTFIYPCDVKVYDDDIIVLTNTMPVFLYGQLNYDQTNFRIWISNVNDATKDTKCSPTSRVPLMGRPGGYY